MKNIVVLYHDDHDGFGAAWAVWKKFKGKAEYIPVQYNDKNIPPANLKNKDIYLLDFCYSADSMKKLVNDNNEVILIDHHNDKSKELKIATGGILKTDNSGAVLTWQYFYPLKKTPKLLQYIEDMDLWRLKIPGTREITAAVELYPMNFKIWDKIAVEMETTTGRKKYIEQGEIILRYQEEIIKKIIRLQATPAIFEGKKALLINSPILESEIGHELIKAGADIGIVWSMKNGSKMKVSLRSDEKKIDVSKLAKRFGGGGHKGAAGFTIKFKNKKSFPWKLTKL